MEAKFLITDDKNDYMLIQDIARLNSKKSVIADIDNVLKYLFDNFDLNHRRLFCLVDLFNDRTTETYIEIVHSKEKFVCFQNAKNIDFSPKTEWIKKQLFISDPESLSNICNYMFSLLKENDIDNIWSHIIDLIAADSLQYVFLDDPCP